MNYIVFDLEWNQSAEGKECSVEHMPFEIIEIGAVKLNSQMKQVSEFHRLVQPKAYKEMHFKISEVTHMDMEELCKTPRVGLEPTTQRLTAVCSTD